MVICIKMYVLYIKTDLKELYTAAAKTYLAKPYDQRDAGFDLVCEACIVGDHTALKIHQKASAALFDTRLKQFRAYWMLPRSSISKTPLRLANAVGLIDAGYRGPLLAAVDNISDSCWHVEMGTRLFQLSAPDLLPFDDIQIVDEIPGGETLRGSGGFGSTGVNYIV